MVRDKPRVFFLHSEMSPYRLALFTQLAEHIDLTVYFCTKRGKGRLWNTGSEAAFWFRSKILRNIKVGRMICNYALPFELSPRFLSHFDVVMVDDDPRLTLSKIWVFIMAKAQGKSIIVWSEAIPEGYFNVFHNCLFKLMRPLRKWLYRGADLLLAYSSKTKSFLQTHGVPDEKIISVPEAVPEPAINSRISKESAKAELGFKNKKIILFVGYLSRRKGVKELILAYKMLKCKDTCLLIAGTGPEEKYLRRIAQDREDIIFTGYADDERKVKLYTAADVFVLPSYVDPWGLVVNEAMMFGLPVIVSAGAGASEMVKGNGFVVAPGDIDALKNVLGVILQDDELRKAMSIKSKSIIKEYSIEKACVKIVEAIKSLIGGTYENCP